MEFYIFPSGPLRTNAILLVDQGIAAVIDPSMGSTEEILKKLNDLHAKIEKILLTHSHWDHIVDVSLLKEKTGAVIYVHRLDAKNMERPGSDQLPLPIAIDGVKPEVLFNDGDIIKVGNLQLEVIHTPGHSPGSVCFYLKEHNLLFSGDTLFCGAIGRTDLATGSPETIWDSLKRLSELPEDTRVIPGHGPETSIGKEL